MIPIIEAIICAGEGLSPEMIHVRDRNRKIVFTRQLIMHYARKITLLTHKEIGKYFGLDHATVVYSCNLIANFIDTDKKMREKIEFYDTKFGIDTHDIRSSALQLYGELNNEIGLLEYRVNELRNMVEKLKSEIK